MCKVVKYWFSCHHGFRLRISRCGGTKHKRVRGGLVAACRSESYLNTVFPNECGPCQHRAFQECWRRKLSVAETFLCKLREKGFPGVQEVATLVGQLKEEYNTASWSTRALFPHLHKERCERVNLGHFDRLPSPLRQELLPEDIAEPPDITQAYDQGYVYDWDYVASTDPFHPVDTDYSHPLDGVDPSWMLNHLTPEEFHESSGGVGFDASEADMMWADDIEEMDSMTRTWEDRSDSTTTDPTKNDLPGDSAAETPLFTPATQTDPPSKTEQVPAEHIKMVIHEFWRTVNDKDSNEASSQSHPNDTFTIQLHELHLPDPSTIQTESYSGLLTPPHTPPRSLTDRAVDKNLHAIPPPPSTVEEQPPSSSPPSHHTATSTTPPLDQCPSTPETSASASDPTSTPARTVYDKWRRHILKLKNADPARYYRDLLVLRRCEIKDIEGPGGRFIPDPPVPRDGGVEGGGSG